MSNYVNLKINGRIFPSWVLANFKKYQLPEIIIEEGKDPCDVGDTKLALRKYQEFIAAFLDYKSPYKDILIYHGMGSGKTASAINVYNMLYNYTPGWNVFILIPASLKQNPWLTDLKIWLAKDEKDERFGNIRFIHYDSPFADRDFLNAIKESDSSKKSLYIFDEAHNFIKNVYNNINSKMGKRAHVIYSYIIQDKKENKSTRVMLLSGTPAVNTPFELALIYNLLRPGIFPPNENRFNEIYSSTGSYKTMNPEKKNQFQRRILGLTSYYVGSTPELFAQKRILYKTLIMDKYQQEVYEHYEFIENEMEKRRAQTRSTQSTYSAYTRQASNFVFPVITSKINGENRPRPSKFRISEKEAEKLAEGVIGKVKTSDTSDRVMLVAQYQDMITLYLKELNNFWDKKKNQDQEKNHTIYDDIEIYKKKYKYVFSDFWKNHKNKSSLLQSLYSCSAKMTGICFNIFRSKGPVIVFSNFVKMEGLEIFKIYLKYFGYGDVNDKNSVDNFRYTEYHGSISREIRENNRKMYNRKDNIYGKIVKIILISPAGSEGISLLNVRQVHIMEPYWHEVRLEQLMARAIRACSHKMLPMSERKVDVFRYKVARGNKKETTDQRIEEKAQKKKKLIGSFLNVIKETAVDCSLFKNHNMIEEKYKCFQFNENVMFNKFIGPAYKEDMYYDSKIDNGLNSIKSIKKKIKVMEIKAVKEISDGKYSEPMKYWYSDDSGVIYDYDLDYPVGKIYKDKNGIPAKLTKDVYIISYLIPIPILKRV